MSLGVEGSKDRLVRAAVRNVVDSLPALVLHNLALEVELALVHGRKEETHAIRVEPESESKRIRGQVLIVVSPVLGGGPVVVRTCSLERLIEHADRNVLRSHEHDVLEQVREPGTPRLFVTRANLVPAVDRDDRR